MNKKPIPFTLTEAHIEVLLSCLGDQVEHDPIRPFSGTPYSQLIMYGYLELCGISHKNVKVTKLGYETILHASSLDDEGARVSDAYYPKDWEEMCMRALEYVNAGGGYWMVGSGVPPLKLSWGREVVEHLRKRGHYLTVVEIGGAGNPACQYIVDDNHANHFLSHLQLKVSRHMSDACSLDTVIEAIQTELLRRTQPKNTTSKTKRQ